MAVGLTVGRLAVQENIIDYGSSVSFCIHSQWAVARDKNCKTLPRRYDDELEQLERDECGFPWSLLSSKERQTIRKWSRNSRSVAKSLPSQGESAFFSGNTVRNTRRARFQAWSSGLEGSLQDAASERGWTRLTEQVRRYNAKQPTRESEDEGYTRPRSIRVVSCILTDVCRCLRACASKADAIRAHTAVREPRRGRASEIAAQPPAALPTCFLSPSRVYFDLLCRR